MIGAIVILYNPDWDLLKECLEALTPQVDEVCIIDNSSIDSSAQFENIGKVRYIPLLKNIGIAAAQNIGIKHFFDANFEYVIFSDQDSVMPNNLVEKLLYAYNDLKEKIDIGAIGP
ncbi:MAG: glycosyltransferase, partial [Phocaeicola sp.]|nr:glycosyltransferase [Phocaeicola sp.]